MGALTATSLSSTSLTNLRLYDILKPMKTIIQTIKEANPTKKELQTAADILRNGGLVAFPTETVYGLGGDGLRADAAQKIYEAKGRPSDNPLIIHIADLESLSLLTDSIPEAGHILAEKFWPGPLTMIFPKSERVPYGTTGGLDTVAVRMPSHPVALGLIRQSGILIAAPSANTSGRPSPTRASHVKEDLDGKIDMILDGGTVGIGIESTIVDLTQDTPMILRPGYITKEMLEDALGYPVTTDKAIFKKADPGLKPKAPGMKYKHYAPKGDLTIYDGNPEAVAAFITERAKKELSEGKTVGIIATEETKELYTGLLSGFQTSGSSRISSAPVLEIIGSRQDEASIAHSLYSLLREFDALGTEIILSECFSSDRLGQAIMNRLLKAAGYQIIHVHGEEVLR